MSNTFNSIPFLDFQIITTNNCDEKTSQNEIEKQIKNLIEKIRPKWNLNNLKIKVIFF